MTRCTATRTDASSTAIMTVTLTVTVTFPSMSSAAGIFSPPSCARPTSMRRRGRKWSGSGGKSASAGRGCAFRWGGFRFCARGADGLVPSRTGSITCSAWPANARLVANIETALAAAKAAAARSGKPARRFKDFKWATLGSSSHRRRVVGKAEWTKGEANPRFVVASLKHSEAAARALYEDIYCARGDMENRIKECQLDLYADRTLAATMRRNQCGCGSPLVWLKHSIVRGAICRSDPDQARHPQREAGRLSGGSGRSQRGPPRRASQS